MENIEYNGILEGFSPVTFIGSHQKRSIAHSESEFITAPIAIEAEMNVEHNLYDELIPNYGSVNNPFESFVSILLERVQYLEPQFSRLVDEHFWELADSGQVSYRNPEAVEPYLRSHPEIKKFLVESWPTVEKHFGKDISVVLEVITYPGEDSYDELVGWIQSTDEIETGLDKLEQFEEEWLAKQLQKISNTFNFNIEFK